MLEILRLDENNDTEVVGRYDPESGEATTDEVFGVIPAGDLREMSKSEVMFSLDGPRVFAVETESDLGQEATPDGVPEGAEYVPPDETPPDDATVHKGPGGATYVTRGDDDGNGADGDSDALSHIPEDATLRAFESEIGEDFPGGSFLDSFDEDYLLNEEDREAIAEGAESYIADAVGGEALASQALAENNKLAQDWKSSSYNQESNRRAETFVEALGLDGDPRNEFIDSGYDPTPADLAYAEYYNEVSQEWARETLGEDFTLSRGVGAATGLEAIGREAAGEPLDLDTNAMENFSAKETSAEGHSDGVVLEMDAEPNDVVVATDAVVHEMSWYLDEHEVTVRGDSVDDDSVDVTIKNNNADLNEIRENPADNLGLDTGKLVAKSGVAGMLTKADNKLASKEITPKAADGVAALINDVVDGLEGEASDRYLGELRETRENIREQL